MAHLTQKNWKWLFYSHPGRFLATSKDCVWFVAFVGALMCLSNWASYSFFIDPFAAWYHDIQARRPPKLQEKYTRIVRIDIHEDHDIFGGRSPLFGDKIVQAVCALAVRGPSVIVVDLDTSSEYDFPTGFSLPNWGIPVVWATDVDDSQGTAQLRADPVLGGRVEPQPRYGIAFMRSDFDHVVRRWQRFEIIGGYSRPTLAWSAVREFCGDENEERREICPDPQELGEQKEQDRETIFSGHAKEHAAFTNDYKFEPIKISEFMPRDETGKGNPRGFPRSCPSAVSDARLNGKIVILGGGFSRSDVHQTPWGPKQGAELVAMAVEQALNRQRSELGEPVLLAFELFLAILIGVIHHWIRPIPATVITIVFLPLGAIAGAELMFHFRVYQVGIASFIVGMLIHQLVGSAKRAEHLAHEYEKALESRSGD